MSHAKYQVSTSFGSKVMDIGPCPMNDDLCLDILQNVQPQEIHVHAKYQVSISTGSKVMDKTLFMTFDLEG